MGPRKKSKPNPTAAPAEATDSPTPDDALRPQTRTPSTRSGRKWLGGTGSWRSKAPALVESSRESVGVSVAGGAASELLPEGDQESRPESPAARFLTKRKSSKGSTIPAAMTKLTVSSNGSVAEAAPQEPHSVVETPAPPTSEPPTEPAAPPEPLRQAADDPPLPPDPVKEPKPGPTSTFGWRGWWSRPDGYPDSAQAKESEAAQTPLPGPTPSEETEPTVSSLPAVEQDTEMKDTEVKDTEMKDAPAATTNAAARTSWFWSWSSAQNVQTASPDDAEAPKPDVVDDPTVENQPAMQEAAAAEDTSTGDSQPVSVQSPKPSGWGFWFRGTPKDHVTADEQTHKQVGEVAVYDTPSQSHPEAAQFNEQEQPREEPPSQLPTDPAETSVAKRSFGSLRGRPKTKQAAKDVLSERPSAGTPITPAKASPELLPTQPDTAPAPQSTPKGQTKVKQQPPNLLLPEFKNTYHLVQKPTYWQQIRQYFLANEPAMPHLHINPAPPRIRKAVAIGVHGFFPAPIVQRVLGQPTGTSIRFATAARKAIDDWTQARGYTAEVEQIALEGEGTVSERVNTLWKLLLNWIDHVQTADFILVACHSQGVPVAVMLVAKLIQAGCVNAARIGICAMAGVNLGPFLEYKTRYFGPAAAELFEFSNPKSLVSQMYLAALDEALRHGVRIMYVGSIDDQLVSLESSTFSTLSHPYIYRAVFVDGRLHAPDFLTHLVGFALKLRNLGLPDHGLIRELSPALAGSLYGGEGHSRLYDDHNVYDLAVQHALETTSLPRIPYQSQGRPSTSKSSKGINIPILNAQVDGKDPYALRVKDYAAVGSGNQNPFFLPWAMRGLLEEEFVKKELNREVEELLSMFEEWRPQGKQLKDVKFRLEGVRSRL